MVESKHQKKLRLEELEAMAISWGRMVINDCMKYELCPNATMMVAIKMAAVVLAQMPERVRVTLEHGNLDPYHTELMKYCAPMKDIMECAGEVLQNELDAYYGQLGVIPPDNNS